jgi:3-hydroxyisobutyrate dehydrogenase-like beta-hydroxyacid dehydrogenase
MMDTKITFIGLGVMGFPMAGHLIKYQSNFKIKQPVTIMVYNRSVSKIKKWLKKYTPTNGSYDFPLQVKGVNNLKEAVSGADCVCACLGGGDEDLREIFLGRSGVVSYMKNKSLIIDHTTTSSYVAEEIHQAAKNKQIGFLDAPVSGGNIGAEKALLSIMVGGQEHDFKRGLPCMSTYGSNIVHVGETGSGQKAKMVNQICIAGLLQGLAEGLAFGKKAGLNMKKVLSVISQGAATSWQMKNRGESMLDGKYDFGFTVKWMLKDLTIALKEADKLGASCSLTKKIKLLYEQIKDKGYENLDTSSLMILTDRKFHDQ